MAVGVTGATDGNMVERVVLGQTDGRDHEGLRFVAVRLGEAAGTGEPSSLQSFSGLVLRVVRADTAERLRHRARGGQRFAFLDYGGRSCWTFPTEATEEEPVPD
jgi:hypothetical protein